jgi:hypothetical protein
LRPRPRDSSRTVRWRWCARPGRSPLERAATG